MTNRSSVARRSRRRLAPADRRSELVDAAIRVLRRDKDEGNWVAAVVAEAAAAKGTFYVYFSSWDEMLAGVRDRLLDGYNAPVIAALEAVGLIEWWELLESQCERFMDLALEFRRHHALIFHSPISRWPTERTRTAPQIFEQLIARGTEHGVFQTPNPQIAATLLFAALHAATDAVLGGAERAEWVAGWMRLAHSYLSPSHQGQDTR